MIAVEHIKAGKRQKGQMNRALMRTKPFLTLILADDIIDAI